MKKYLNSVVAKFNTEKDGNAAVGTYITVRNNGTGVLSSIYVDDGITPKENPFQVDDNGNYEFYAADGKYDIIQNEGKPSEIRLIDVDIFDAQGFISLNLKSAEVLSLSKLPYPEGSKVSVTSFYSSSPAGAATWRATSMIGQTPSQLPTSRTDGRLVDGLGRVWELCAPYMSLAQVGVLKDSGVNETAGIISAINYHAEKGITLYADAGEYIFDGISRTGKENINIVGINGRAVFKSTAVNQRTFRFQCNNEEVSVTLDSDISAGQNSITVTDSAALQVGMMIRITSNVLWPYDARSVYYRGETHLIERIEGSVIYFTDYTRDNYTLAQIDSITAWMPAKLKLENLEVDHSDFRGTSCYQITGYYEPIFRNLKSIKAKTAGLWMLRCWHPRAYDIHSEYIGDGIETGYGAQDRSCVGLRIDGFYTVGCRRSFDAETESGSNSSPSRDYLVTNFVVRGGGDYFPETAETSYGIGNHGPSENGRFISGKIYDCKVGVNHRGSKLELNDIEVYGQCDTVIDGTFGSGYTIDNVRYYPTEYPIAVQDMSALTLSYLPECFVRFGRSSTTDADFNFDLPINISNCSAVGVRDAFIYSENATQKLGNLNVVDNSISIATDASLTDFFFVRHVSTLSRSNFDSNKVEAGDRDWIFCNNDVGVRDGIDDRYGVMIDGAWTFRIQDDDFIRIPSIATYTGARPIIGLSSDAIGREIFEIRPENATKVTQSASSWASLVATATPTSINGTFGVDGEYTVGLTSKNEIYLENRGGAERGFRLSLVL